MADLSDVENALGATISAALYPGTAAGNSVASLPVRVETGWPESQELDQAMAAGSAIVSIYASPGAERNTTRYPDTATDGPIQPATYTLSVSGQTVTIGGQGAAYSQNLAMTVNGATAIVTATNQAPADLAASLAALVPDATASGATVNLPPLARLGAVLIGTVGVSSREVRRQERQFQISVWAPTPEARVAVVEAVDPVLADLPRLPLPDGQLARLTYRSSIDNDADQLRGIYRRDLIYACEYATNRTITATQIVAAETLVAGPYPVDVAAVIVVTGGALDFTNPDNSGLSALI